MCFVALCVLLWRYCACCCACRTGDMRFAGMLAVCVCVPTQGECVRCGRLAVGGGVLCANHAAIQAQRKKNNTASGASRQQREATRAAAKAAAMAGKEANQASVGMAAWGAPV